jgi:glycine hydroxymethyltransferase
MNIIAAKAQCFIEALAPEFSRYARQVKFNAQCMARKFKENNIDLQTSGTDSHLLLLNLSNTAWSGKALANTLEAQGITVNKNGVPNDHRSFTETSGIRIGTAAETTRGKDEVEFMEIAIRISDIINEGQ